MERFIEALDFSDLFIWERDRRKCSERGGNTWDDVGDITLTFCLLQSSRPIRCVPASLASLSLPTGVWSLTKATLH